MSEFFFRAWFLSVWGVYVSVEIHPRTIHPLFHIEILENALKALLLSNSQQALDCWDPPAVVRFCPPCSGDGQGQPTRIFHSQIHTTAGGRSTLPSISVKDHVHPVLPVFCKYTCGRVWLHATSLCVFVVISWGARFMRFPCVSAHRQSLPIELRPPSSLPLPDAATKSNPELFTTLKPHPLLCFRVSIVAPPAWLNRNECVDVEEILTP